MKSTKLEPKTRTTPVVSKPVVLVELNDTEQAALAGGGVLLGE